MNASFERAQSSYPIGYLRSSKAESVEYRITDMRTLEPLDVPSVPLNHAVQIANTLNEHVRRGVPMTEINETAKVLVAKG